MPKGFKSNRLYEYNGIPLVARDDVPPGIIYVINDKVLGEELLRQAILNEDIDMGKAIKDSAKNNGKIINIEDED